MQTPRIHFFIADLRGGGAERAVVEVMNHINRDDFMLTLIVLKKNGTYLRDLDSEIPVIELLDKKPFSGKLYILRRLIGHINRTKPDVIIGFTTPIVRFMLSAKLFCSTQTRYVAVEQNNVSLNIIQSYRPGINTLMQWFTRLLYNTADKIATVSEGIKERIINDYKIDPQKCLTIYNPVNISRVQQLASQLAKKKLIDDKVYLVAVGRLVPQKGYEDMIEAIRLVNRETPCKLLILGEGPLRKTLEEKVFSLGLTDTVLMPGFVEKPWPYLSAATLFLSTSHWEGFSLAHIEAMACGVPLVLTNCDYGPKELVLSQEIGTLVSVGDISQIADRIKELLLDERKRKRIASNARQYVNKFDSLVIAQQYEKMIENILAV